MIQSQRFVDDRLHSIVNSIIPFSPKSVSLAIGEVWRTKSSLGDEEDVHGLAFLTMINKVTELFSSFHEYFNRGPAQMDASLVPELLETLLALLSGEARLGGAGLTSSLDAQRSTTAVEAELGRLHETRLDSEDYERLQAVQDSLVLNLLRPYLPKFVRTYLARLPDVIDRAIRDSLGIGRDELIGLTRALGKLRERGVEWGRPDEAVLARYRHLALTPHQLFHSTVEHLYSFPPFLIERGPNEYCFIVVEQPFVWIKKKEIEFIRSIQQQHPDVVGGSLERLLKMYLVRRTLVEDENPPLCMVGVERAHPKHFQSAHSGLHLSRNTREDLFAILRNPEQPEMEIDLVASHREGFSIIAEAKYVTSYRNAKAYYLRGSRKKEPERERLLHLSDYLNCHPSWKSEFRIPREDVVVPVFITNAVGPLFAEKDGVVKACPLEVMKVEPFYRLVKAEAQTTSHNLQAHRSAQGDF